MSNIAVQMALNHQMGDDHVCEEINGRVPNPMEGQWDHRKEQRARGSLIDDMLMWMRVNSLMLHEVQQNFEEKP